MKAGHRHQLDHVVYMYLNTATEMVYVGSTKYGIKRRHGQHMRDATAQGRKSRFHKALAAWPESFWEVLVLERCSTVEELDALETKWITECCALDEGVGYNTYDAQYLRLSHAGGRAMKGHVFTDAERAARSAAGRKGAARAAELMNYEHKRAETEEKWAAMSEGERQQFFRECGKRGASGATKGAHKGMSETERERYREWGRKGAAKSKALAAQQA